MTLSSWLMLQWLKSNSRSRGRHDSVTRMAFTLWVQRRTERSTERRGAVDHVDQTKTTPAEEQSCASASPAAERRDDRQQALTALQEPVAARAGAPT
jgi:hypothetical protein